MSDILQGAPLVICARVLATVVHHGQTDKAGNRYITHPERVAAKLYSPEGKAAALLHDTIEDTPVTADALRAGRYPEAVVVAVEAVSHRPHEGAAAYLQRIIDAGPLAIDVKVADMHDNLTESRLAELREEVAERLRGKYRPRIETLVEARARLYPDAPPS